MESIDAKGHNTACMNKHHAAKDLLGVVRRGYYFLLTAEVEGSYKDLQIVGEDIESTKLHKVLKAENEKRKVTLKVYVKQNAKIGYHDLLLKAGDFEKKIGRVVVLFNPWDKESSVYLPDSDERYEYILREEGRIWKGNTVEADNKGAYSNSWMYHQCELLPIVLKVIDNEKLSPDERRHPSTVSRFLTSILHNTNYENGVCYGFWGEDYSEGTHPNKWTGSRKVFEEWNKSGEPTKFCQCFVFAGLLTSALRSLGVPARPVTIYRSGHDFAPYDHIIVPAQSESIWNYHVIVEAWMNRPDLKYSSPYWNVVDATPQETSDGLDRCGPGDVRDIRNNKKANFDNAFIIGEMAGVKYTSDKPFDAATWRMHDMDSKPLGNSLMTKAVGSCKSGRRVHGYCGEELIPHFKKFSNPFQQVESFFFKETKGHMYSTDIQPANPNIGDTITITVQRGKLLQERLTEPTEMKLKIVVESICYNGKHFAVVSKFEQTCMMHPDPSNEANTCMNEGGEWELVVNEDTYRKHLKASNAMRVTVSIDAASAAVNEKDVHAPHGDGSLEYTFEDEFVLNLPDVEILVPDNIVAGKPFRAKMIFNNPLQIPLTGVQASIDTSDVDRVAKFNDIRPDTKVMLITHDIVISYPTTKQEASILSLAIETNEIAGFYGDVEFEVYATMEEALAAGKNQDPKATVDGMIDGELQKAPVDDIKDGEKPENSDGGTSGDVVVTADVVEPTENESVNQDDVAGKGDKKVSADSKTKDSNDVEVVASTTA